MSWRWTVSIALGGIALLLGGLEWWTLNDSTPDNHVTAAFRQLAGTDLGVLVLVLVALIVGVLLGHFFPRWGRGARTPRLALLATALAASASPAWTQDSYVRGSLRYGVESFDRLDSAASFQGVVTARLALDGGRWGVVSRADSARKSGVPTFDDAELWRTVDAHVLPFYRVARTVHGYEILVAPEVSLSFAVSDTVEQFGRRLDARPVRWGGCVVARSRDSYYAACGGQDDLSAAGRGAAWGSLNRRIGELRGMPAAISIDWLVPFDRDPLGDPRRGTWSVETMLSIDVFQWGER